MARSSQIEIPEYIWYSYGMVVHMQCLETPESQHACKFLVRSLSLIIIFSFVVLVTCSDWTLGFLKLLVVSYQ